MISNQLQIKRKHKASACTVFLMCSNIHVLCVAWIAPGEERGDFGDIKGKENPGLQQQLFQPGTLTSLESGNFSCFYDNQ